MTRVIITFFFLLFLSISYAQQVLILDTEEKTKIGKYVTILEDSTNNLTIENVIKANNKFQICNTDIYSHKVSSYAYWVKFRVKNLTCNKYLLEINNPAISYLEIYTIKNEKPVLVKKSGTLVPFTQRDIKVNNHILTVDIPYGEITAFYIKYISVSQPELPISLRTAKKEIEHRSLTNLLYGIFYGLFIFAIIYNVFLLISTKDKSYIYYVGFITFFLLFRLQMNGHAYQFFYPNYPQLSPKISFLTFAGAALFMLSFALSFLKTKSSAPKLYILSQLLFIPFIVAYIVSYFDKYLSVSITSIAFLVIPPFLFFLGLYIYIKGYKPARYYLIASTFYLVTAFINVLKQSLILPFSSLANNANNIGTAIEAMLFSFALGDQFIQTEKKKREFQKKLNMELELKIQERIKAQEEMDKLNEKLRDANINIDNFLFTASHELKSDISGINNIINFLDSESLSKEEAIKKIDKIDQLIDKFKTSVNSMAELNIEEADKKK